MTPCKWLISDLVSLNLGSHLKSKGILYFWKPGCWFATKRAIGWSEKFGGISRLHFEGGWFGWGWILLSWVGLEGLSFHTSKSKTLIVLPTPKSYLCHVEIWVSHGPRSRGAHFQLPTKLCEGLWRGMLGPRENLLHSTVTGWLGGWVSWLGRKECFFLLFFSFCVSVCWALLVWVGSKGLQKRPIILRIQSLRQTHLVVRVAN